MSVLSYLQARASHAILSPGELGSINTSINSLASKLNSYFGSTIKGHFRFGSATRGTILPRAMDEHSDIDYMIVFTEKAYSPQTYINQLRRFAEKYYSMSIVGQSSPTIVLELNHIKFDLVPAFKGFWTGTYEIPDGASAWRDTSPNEFNASLSAKNQAELNFIKPTIRLAKFWNAQAGYVFNSFEFEKWIVALSYSYAVNQRDYLFTVFDNLRAIEAAQWRNDRITRAKQIIARVREYEQNYMPISAEVEVRKLIPG